MQLETEIRLVNGAYHVETGVAELTPMEREALAQQGEQLIDCGGTITSGEITFTLPSNIRRFPSQFPVKQIFSIADFSTNAQPYATAFRAVTEGKLQTARNTVVADSAAGIGHWVTTV